MIKEAISKLISRVDLTRREIETVTEEIMTGNATPCQIAAFLVALRTKGETIQEITGAAAVMRKHVKKIKTDKGTVLDTCGTGGDQSHTFNISTIAAFVAAGSGITVAKHGNRSVTSRCGSADLLEALGVNININEEKIEECLVRAGIAFLFAPSLHPAMKYATPVRQEIGIRTIFNILGPLTNPAGATHQLIGVYDEKWTAPIAKTLVNLGSKHALVVHGLDGLDEVTTTTATIISEARRGKVKTYKVTPKDFGVKKAKPKDLVGGSPEVNSEICRNILNGEKSPARDIVLVNSACAIYAADRALDIKEALKIARDSLDSGKALEKLELLKRYSS